MVPSFDIGGHGDFVEEHVGFAVLAGHADGEELVGGAAIAADPVDGVFGAVEGWAGVVAESAVGGDVGAGAALGARGALDGADGVEGDAGFGDEAAPGFVGEGDGEPAINGFADGGGDGLAVGEDVHRLVVFGVVDAEAAADVDDGGFELVAAEHADGELGNGGTALDLGVGVEELGADVAVEPDEGKAEIEDAAEGVFGAAVGNIEAEFGVGLAGGDFAVGFGIDAGGEAEDEVGAVAELGEAVNLFEAVHDDLGDFDFGGAAELGDGFVVSVEVAVGGRDAGAQGGFEFAFAGDINAAAFLVGDLEDGEGGVGFAGEADFDSGAVFGGPGGAGGIEPGADAGAQMGFVNHIQRGIELGDE